MESFTSHRKCGFASLLLAQDHPGGAAPLRRLAGQDMRKRGLAVAAAQQLFHTHRMRQMRSWRWGTRRPCAQTHHVAVAHGHQES